MTLHMTFPETNHSENLFQKAFCVFKYPKELRHNSLKILIFAIQHISITQKRLRDGKKWIGYSKSALHNYLRTTIKVHGAILLLAYAIDFKLGKRFIISLAIRAMNIVRPCIFLPFRQHF